MTLPRCYSRHGRTTYLSHPSPSLRQEPASWTKTCLLTPTTYSYLVNTVLMPKHICFTCCHGELGTPLTCLGQEVEDTCCHCHLPPAGWWAFWNRMGAALPMACCKTQINFLALFCNCCMLHFCTSATILEHRPACTTTCHTCLPRTPSPPVPKSLVEQFLFSQATCTAGWRSDGYFYLPFHHSCILRGTPSLGCFVSFFLPATTSDDVSNLGGGGEQA